VRERERRVREEKKWPAASLHAVELWRQLSDGGRQRNGGAVAGRSSSGNGGSGARVLSGGGGCGVGDEEWGCGGLNWSGHGRLFVRPVAPRDAAARNGRTRTRVQVGCWEGDDKPDRRAPPVSAEGEGGEEGGAGSLGQDGGMGRAPVRERKNRGKRATAGWAVGAGGLRAGKRKGGRGKRPWAGL
jgi:hypothetical protein